jgi:hypothetical protein
MLVACDPRRNALVRSGSKSDRIDAEKLAELLRIGALSSVYHSPQVTQLRVLLRHYEALVNDVVPRAALRSA